MNLTRLLASGFFLIIVNLANAGPLDDAKLATQNRDYAKAAAIYKTLAEQGDAKAQYNLGVMYFHGDGVKQDYGEAIRHYRLAANQGFAEAQYALAVIYFTNKVTPPNYEESLRLYQQAAEQGHVKSQLNLGLVYLKGEVVPQDNALALKWLRTAANQGYGEAQYVLANMYMHGEGVPPDVTRSYMWVALSMEDKNESPSKIDKREHSLKFMSIRMTPEELAAGKALLEQCHAKQLQDC